MYETPMTITGNVCDEPKLRLTSSGHSVANLRVASTPRRYDQRTGSWVDGTTLFVNVTCWRALADHVAASIHKGDPVVVTGRYTSRTYEVGEQLRYTQVLEATSLGHDLARGTTVFTKAARSAAATSYVPADENGVPVDDSERWLDFAANPGQTEESRSDQELVSVG